MVYQIVELFESRIFTDVNVHMAYAHGISTKIAGLCTPASAIEIILILVTPKT